MNSGDKCTEPYWFFRGSYSYMQRRTVLGVAAAFALAGCLGDDDDESAAETPTDTPTDSPTDTPTETPTDTPTDTPTPEEEPDPIVHSGAGATTTDEFELAGGFTVLYFDHDGDDDFSIDLHGPDGGDHSVFSGAGEVDAVWADGLAGGDWTMEVEADGSWQVVIQQPRIAEGSGNDAEVVLEGDASGTYKVLELPGEVEVTGEHLGTNDFVVRSLDRHGDTHDDTVIFDESGPFEGETTIDFEGTSWIVIQANGDWQVVFDPV